MNKKIKGIIIFGILLLICIILIFSFNTNKEIKISYNEFVQDVTDKKVENVEIATDKILIKLKDDNNLYCTANPDYDGFKEYLLLNDIEIVDDFGYEDIISIFDILFYVIFIGAVVFGIYKIYSFTTKDFKIIKKNNVKFDDIAGLENLKKDMMKEIEVFINPSEYAKKGIRPAKGIILEGPPGNGKTLFAKALAGEANVNFIATKGADFQSAMMSVGPRKIRTLFNKARKNKPCIIFIDEFDGIGERRNYAGTGIDKENNRMIIAMLNEMDGFKEQEGVLVIGATNSYASLDAALVRPGRFDRKYRIDNPDNETITKLIDLYTKHKKLDSNINIPSLVKCFNGLSSAAIATLLNEATLESDVKEHPQILMEDIVEAGKKTGIINIKIK